MKKQILLLCFAIVMLIGFVELASAATWNATFTEGLKNYWRFDSPSGTTESDVIGGNTITLQNAAMINTTTCKTGNCLIVQDTAYGGEGSPLVGDSTGRFTISFWARPETNSQAYSPFVANTANTGAPFSDGDFRVIFGGSITTLEARIGGTNGRDSGGTYTPDAWNLYTLVYDGTKGIEYDNGTFILNTPGFTYTTFGAGNIAVLEPPEGAATHYGIDELAIWNRSLTASEVADLWNGGAGIFYPSTPAAPAVTFNYQLPADIDSSNLFSNPLNITYNISSAGTLNLSTIQLFYKSNSTTRNIIKFVNGTGIDVQTTNYNYNTSSTFSFILDHDIVYGGTYNINSSVMENTRHQPLLLGSANTFIQTQLLNVANTTAFNFLMAMVNASTNANNLQFVYCNSSYGTGDPLSNANCNIFATWSPVPTFNFTEGNSSYKIVPFIINTTSGTIGNVVVTNSSEFILRGTNTGQRFVHTINVTARAGASKLSTNGGTAWTNQNYTMDLHLHQFTGNSSIYYNVCANDTLGQETCSSVRNDLFQIGNVPPTAPVVYAPTNGTFFKNININYTAAVSFNGYQIQNYNITLWNANSNTFNQSINVYNGQSLGYVWDSSAIKSGDFYIEVRANDSLNQESFGDSVDFSINNTFTNFTNVNVNAGNGSFTTNQTNLTLPEGGNATFTGTGSQTGFIDVFFQWFVDGVLKLSGIAQNVFNYVFNNPSTSPNSTIVVNANSTITGENFTKTFNISTNSQNPVVSIQAPSPFQNLTSTDVQVNFTASDQNLQTCWFVNGTINSTITCSTPFNLLASQGTNVVNVYANDSVGNIGSASQTFFVDSIAPLINFNAPTPSNNTQIGNVLNVNVSVNSPFNGICQQETANLSRNTDGSCSLSYTGAYAFNDRSFLINYTKPVGAQSTSLWRLRYGYNNVTQNAYDSNFTIPSDCWTYSNSVLVLNVYSLLDSLGTTGVSYGQCFNGTRFENITTISSWHNASGSAAGGIRTDFLYDGDYTNTSQEIWREIGGNGWSQGGSYHIPPDGNLGGADMGASVFDEAMVWNISGGLSNSTGDLKNLSVYLYNSSSDLINSSTSTNSPHLAQFTNLSVGRYFFKGVAYDNFGNVNSTETREVNVANNFTTILNFTASINEDTNTTIFFNLTSNFINNLNATLFYNGNPYSMTGTFNSTFGDFSAIVHSPVAPGGNFEVPVYVNFTLDGTQYLTSTINQTIVSLAPLVVSTSCNDKAMAFNVQDEQNFTNLSVNINYNFHYGITNETLKSVFGSINNTGTFYVCINSTASNAYKVGSGEIDYQEVSGAYVLRRYYVFEGHTLTNATENITLYDLANGAATSFLIQSSDSTLKPEANKYLGLLRWYPQLNTYNLVEMAQTDETGTSIFRTKTEDVQYRVALWELNGTLIKLNDPTRFACLVQPCTYSFLVFPDDQDFTSFTGIQSSLTFNESSSKFVYVWNDPSQKTLSMNLTITKETGLNSGVICNSIGIGSVGAINCNVSGQSGTLRAVVYRAASPPVPIAQLVQTIGAAISSVASTMGLFISGALAIIGFFIGIFNPVIGIIMMVASLIPAVYLGAVTMSIVIGVAILGFVVIHFMGRRR